MSSSTRTPYTAEDVQRAAAQYNRAADLPQDFEVRHTVERRRFGFSLAQRGNPYWYEIVAPIHSARAMTELLIDRAHMQAVRFRAWYTTLETMPPGLIVYNASRTVRVSMRENGDFQTWLMHAAFMGHQLEFLTPAARRSDLVQFLAR